jgi:hypothetical protein
VYRRLLAHHSSLVDTATTKPSEAFLTVLRETKVGTFSLIKRMMYDDISGWNSFAEDHGALSQIEVCITIEMLGIEKLLKNVLAECSNTFRRRTLNRTVFDHAFFYSRPDSQIKRFVGEIAHWVGKQKPYGHWGGYSGKNSTNDHYMRQLDREITEAGGTHPCAGMAWQGPIGVPSDEKLF